MLTRQQAEELLGQVLDAQSELDEAECKSGLGNALQRALCAMSNRRDRNGGIVFVGIGPDFGVVGVDEVEATQEKLSDWASQAFNVPLRISPEIIACDGREIIAVIVPSCPTGHRPCHFRKKGPYEGAWIRVGNSTRLMTSDEVRRAIVEDEIARGAVLPFDCTPYTQAQVNALDDDLVRQYAKRVASIRPGFRIEHLPQENILRGVKAIAEYDGAWRPTPTGLLFFCTDPQQYLPQSSVEFLHLWGPKLTDLGPDGSRWRMNREVVGTLPQIIDQVEALLLERIATRGFIDSFRRRDEPEYPRFALRESVVNAVAHRDYTMRGSRIQVRLFPDRVEVHTPGGLPAPVTVDNIEDEQASRNEGIVALLQDLGYMERRGYGFNGIVVEMRQAGLAPPLLRDSGASFDLCLRSHVLMTAEAVGWLGRFDALPLSPQERLALAYLRVNDRLYNRDYVRLNDCTRDEATQALRHMVELRVIDMKGRRGGAYYVLAEGLHDRQASLFDAKPEPEDVILRMVRAKGKIRRKDVVEALGCAPHTAYNLLRKLKERGKLHKEGEKRGAKYSLPEE